MKNLYFCTENLTKTNIFIMKRLPIKFKTSVEESILILESRSEKSDISFNQYHF